MLKKSICICILLLTCFIFHPFNTNAQSCSEQELQEYKELARNIRINYEHIESNSELYDENNLFSITVSNIPKEVKVFESKESYYFINDTLEKFSTVKYDNFPGGIKTNFIFYTTDNTNCPNEKIAIKNIQLPVYNEYWKDELCNGIESYLYCSKVISNKITYEGFKKNVIKYKESLNNEIIDDDNKKEKKIKDYVLSNYGLILISVILIIIIVAFYIKKRGVFDGKKI